MVELSSSVYRQRSKTENVPKYNYGYGRELDSRLGIVMDSEDVLRVCAVSHRYSKSWAVRDISFSLGQQGVTGLLGSNGAGKSTTMNVICGVLAPTEGDVWIKGHSVRQNPRAAKSNLGFLPQQVPVYPEFTVDEYLNYCCALKGVPKSARENAIVDACNRVGITHFRKRLIGALSGGYKQRVGIAQAILKRPALFVLDEPTTGLDPNQIVEVRKLIRNISHECAVLVSTHILSEVEALCDDVKMVENGRLVFEGSLPEFSRVAKTNQVLVEFASTPSVERILDAIGLTVDIEAVNARRFRMDIPPGYDDGSVLLDRLVAAGLAIREWKLENVSLERVFSLLSGRLSGSPENELKSERG